ncbi:hypothetical protein A4G19_08410 [Pasteurellaceae bacterium Macca]|nr:hypothetical protein [Pasteurellaceae bacterium Macca]
MKKLFIASLLGFLLTACDGENKTVNTETTTEKTTTEQVAQKEESEIKAIMLERIAEKPFTKNAKGTVIFNSVTDMFDDFGTFSLEDKNIKVISEKPLSIQLFHNTFPKLDAKHQIMDVEDVFISSLLKVFTYTNTNEITLEVIPVDLKTKKPINKKYNYKTTVSREKALEILKTYSSANSFDDLVNFDKNDPNNIVGYSGSDISIAIRNDKVRSYVANALKTGKLTVPTEYVIIPIGFDMNTLAEKLVKFDSSVFIQTRKLNDGNNAYRINLGEVVMLEGIGKEKKNLDYLTVQFGFVNDQNLILQMLAALSVSSTITPNSDKTFKEMTKMVDKASKMLKKQESIKIKSIVDGFTLELSIHKNLGGLSYFTIKKLETRPMKFQ